MPVICCQASSSLSFLGSRVHDFNRNCICSPFLFSLIQLLFLLPTIKKIVFCVFEAGAGMEEAYRARASEDRERAMYNPIHVQHTHSTYVKDFAKGDWEILRHGAGSSSFRSRSRSSSSFSSLGRDSHKDDRSRTELVLISLSGAVLLLRTPSLADVSATAPLPFHDCALRFAALGMKGRREEKGGTRGEVLLDALVRFLLDDNHSCRKRSAIEIKRA